MTSRTPTPEDIKKIQEHWEAPKADMVNHPPHYKTGGMYSIAEIEEMLVHIKKEKERQDRHLKAAIQPTKEKNA